MEEIIIFISDNYKPIATGIISFWEVFVRIRPTEKNLSLFDNLYSLYIWLVPNNCKSKEDFGKVGSKRAIWKLTREIKNVSKNGQQK